MIPPNEVHAFGVLNFERQQQADSLQRMCSPVHIIPQEEVINVGDVPCSAWRAVLLKESHEIQKLAVQIPKDLHRSCKKA